METTKEERAEFAALMTRLFVDWLFPQALYRLTKEEDWPRREALIKRCLAEMGTDSARQVTELIGASAPLVSFYGSGSYNPYADKYEDDMQDKARPIRERFMPDLALYAAS